MTARVVLVVNMPSPDEGDYDREEQDDISSNVEALGAQINARNILCRDEVPLEFFKRVVSDSHLVYYHGHCDLIKAPITEQSLRLTDGNGAAAEFTMKDFFNLSLDSLIVMLVACNLAMKLVLAGNESLGLATSILTTGVSSAIGTLWEVASETARIFAERFMKALVEAGGEGMIDISVSSQQIVINLISDCWTRLLYHWAPLVPHGACISKNLGICGPFVDIEAKRVREGQTEVT